MNTKGIARSLRAQLDALGLTLSHSQTLELLAKTADLKDWNVLAAKKPDTPAPVEPVARKDSFFCPGCGKRGTVSSTCSAFVEQGPGNQDGFIFEGDTDHYSCSACGHQFLNWQSRWPG
jgi:predicted RNA-binding Zn-ribbon protein involved in translation (DUF1610 family)